MREVYKLYALLFVFIFMLYACIIYIYMMYMSMHTYVSHLFHAIYNFTGQDTIINVTVIKPRPSMTYEELGLIVWNWPYLCVREVKSGSIFEHTAIQEMDQIAAINDIDCTKLREVGFKRCASELPTEITITLIRRKHRYTGSYY